MTTVAEPRTRPLVPGELRGDEARNPRAREFPGAAGPAADPHRKFALASLVVLTLLYGLVEMIPGRFAVTDEVFYKAAGRNWAMTGRFAAPEIVGRFKAGPPLTEVYFAQPPLYAFLFGLYTKLAGFSPRLCMLYDVLIHLLLVWSCVAVARTVFKLPWGFSVLCGVLAFPLGTVGRGDELGIIFALWGAVAFRSGMPRRSGALVGGAMLGLCCATCLGAFVFLGPLAALELLRGKQTIRERISSFCAAAAAGLAAVAACVAPILVNHPAAYQQLIGNTREQSAALSFLTGNGWKATVEFFQVWKTGFRYGFQYAILAAGLLLFAAVCLWLDESRAADYQRVVPGVVSLGCLAAALPGKCLYFWFPAVWLLIACVALAAQASRAMSRARRHLLFAFGAGVWLAASVLYLQQKAILWTMPADQSLDLNTSRLRAEIPPGVAVRTTDFWWALADRDRVYDPLFANPGSDEPEYTVLSGNGSGKPSVPRGMNPEYRTAGMEIAYDHLNSTPESLFGIPITRSAYGFGAYVLKKKRGG